MIWLLEHMRVLCCANQLDYGLERVTKASRRAPRRGKRAALLIKAPAVLSLCLALVSCDARPDEGRNQTQLRSVFTVKAHYATSTQSSQFAATVVPKIMVDIAFRVAGKVATRKVDVGQSVSVGEVVATLDQADFKLQLSQAEAELAAATMASSTLRSDEERAAKLHTNGWISQAAHDRMRAAAKDAAARLQRASDAVALAKNALSYADLRADFAGVVTQTSIEPGQVVVAGQSAIRLARGQEFEAEVALPETYVSAARTGEARLILWSRPDAIYRATLRELSPIADLATRTFKARFTILAPDPSLLLGLSARLEIANADAQPTIAVPLASIFNQGRGPELWKVAGDRIVATKIKIVRLGSDSAFVVGEIADGEDIVALGAQKLDETQRVRVVVAGNTQ